MDIKIPEKRGSAQRNSSMQAFVKRFGWVVGIGIFIFITLIYLSEKANTTTIRRSELTFGAVKRGVFTVESRGSGVFKPRLSWWVSAESTATVKEIYINSGDKVTAGQKIMMLSDPVMEESIQTQKWQVSIIEGNLRKAKSARKEALLDQEINITVLEKETYSLDGRVLTEQNLRDRNYQSMGNMQWESLQRELKYSRKHLELEKEKYEFIRNNHDSNLSVLKDQLQQAKFTQKQLETKYNNLNFVAERDGIIQELLVEVGEKVIQGDELYKLATNGKFIAEVKISQDEISQIATGQKAIIRNRDNYYNGHVLRIDGAVENGTVKVELEIDDDLPPGIRADQRVDATITLARLEDSLYVERPAFVQANREGWAFRVIEGEDRVERIRVDFGKAGVQSIQIVEGLSVDDKIVLSEPNSWIDKEEFYLR